MEEKQKPNYINFKKEIIEFINKQPETSVCIFVTEKGFEFVLNEMKMPHFSSNVLNNNN